MNYIITFLSGVPLLSSMILTLIYTILIAIVNYAFIEQKSLRGGMDPEDIEKYNKLGDMWHGVQFYVRGFQIVGIAIVCFSTLSFLNMVILFYAIGGMHWLMFDTLLNIFRGEKIMHKGKNWIDKIFKTNFIAFMVKIIAFVIPTLFYLALNY